jgi:putative glycosyltransferase (TIGR04348 family)
MSKQRNKQSLLIVTPALATANNGNWQTAKRWGNFLKANYHVNTQLSFHQGSYDGLIALHAGRSFESVQAFASTKKPIVLILTGTDLYKDIKTDQNAQKSLQLADRLVLLQSDGITVVPTKFHTKCVTIYQSAPSLKRLEPRKTSFDLTMVGHLREVKDPLTATRALMRCASPALQLRIVGGSKDDALLQNLLVHCAHDRRIHYLGALSHAATRKEIRRAQLLVIPSLMEGGANVIIEAITSGVPVLASNISGSRGMLGDTYPGYFEAGDDQTLARLIERCQTEPDFLDTLKLHCSARAHLFKPLIEAQAVNQLIGSLLF